MKNCVLIMVMSVVSTDNRDLIYAKPLTTVGAFTFDDTVAAVFPDMIKRSVPGYQTVIAMTGVLAARYAQQHSTCYDLGCSLGEGTFAMRSQIKTPNCSIVAVDNSSDMLQHCQTNALKSLGDVPVSFVIEDISELAMNESSVVVLNYTLQFIPFEKRDALLRKIYQSLKPGGILLLSEKIEFSDHQLNERMIALHHEFKKANGYSDLEISQKRTALEHVLLPETMDEHKKRLDRCGYQQVDVWFQCFNFMSLIAYK